MSFKKRTNSFELLIRFHLIFFVVLFEKNLEKKNRVIVDIRDLNAVTQSNAYSVSLQSNII